MCCIRVKFELLKLLDIVGYICFMSIVHGPSGRFTQVIVILMFGTCYMQVLYFGRTFRTNETLPDFREKCRVIRHSRVFRWLTGSQRIPGFWDVTDLCIIGYFSTVINN